MVKYFKTPSQYFQDFFEKNNPSCIQCFRKWYILLRKKMCGKYQIFLQGKIWEKCALSHSVFRFFPTFFLAERFNMFHTFFFPVKYTWCNGPLLCMACMSSFNQCWSCCILQQP